MVKTASFSTGLQAPGQAQMAAAAEEQQMLARLLQEQSQGVTAPAIDTGRFKVLNLEGFGNAVAAGRTREKAEIARKKALDANGEYQRGLSEALRKWSSSKKSDPTAIEEGLNSPYEEVRNRAADANKNQQTMLAKLLEKASLASGKAAVDQGIGALQPRENRQLQNGSVIDMTEGRQPSLVAGGFRPGTLPNGTAIDVNQLTGERNAVDRAPRTEVNVGAEKAGTKILERKGTGLVEVGAKLAAAVPSQLRALESAEQASNRGAFQGPLAGFVQGAAGIGAQLGLAPEAVKSLLSNTEILDSDMGRFVLESLKATGTNPSNADREYAERTAGGKKLSPDGLVAVIRAARADIVNSTLEHNRQVDQLLDRVPEADLARVPVPEITDMLNPQGRVPPGTVAVPGYVRGEGGFLWPATLEQAKPASPAARPKYSPEDLARFQKYGVTPP